MLRSVTLTLLLIFSFQHFSGQADSIPAPALKNRRLLLSGGVGLATVSSLLVLNQAWYSSYNTGKFHFFNDNEEWLQMDKAGHTFTTYQTSRLMMEAFQWADYNRKQTLWIGGTIGFFYMTAIEVMDGFSRGWGYSWGDQLSDVVGSSLAIGQEAAWKEQRLLLKFSFAKSGLAQYNPELLGKSTSSQILKDYNAQTYWLSVNPASFLNKETKFPRWLNIAVGYGAFGMLGGHYNRVLAENEQGVVFRMERERRYYLSLDLDLSKIKTRSKVLKTLFSVINILKFPAPALQLSKGKLRLYPVYY